MIVTTTLRKVSLFSGLSDSELGKLSTYVRSKTVEAGQILFAEGDPGQAVYFVESGRVKISKISADGREQILHFMGPGEVFGEVVLFEEGAYPATAEAVEDSRVGLILRRDIQQFIQENGEVAFKMLCLLSRRLREAQAKVHELALKNVYGRIAGLLVRLSDQGCKLPDGVLVPLVVTRAELANMIGTSRESVSRVLSEWNQKGIIRPERCGIVIMDMKRLKEYL